MQLTIFVTSFILSVILCFFYIKTWRRLVSNKTTPTGYGLLIPIKLILLPYFFDINLFSINIYLILLVLSIIYWFDDLKSISSSIRILIQFFSGVLICFILIQNKGLSINFYLLILIIASGLINIFLTNIINFYDGLDLNISTLIILLSLTILYKINYNPIYTFNWLIIMGFILGFVIYNLKPNTIFFGDSGCYVIAFILNILIIEAILNFDFKIIYLFIPLFLPIFDVLYVLIKRIKRKEHLLSRNYYHLYHVLDIKFKNKIYLLPQIINFILIYILSLIFKLNDFYSILLFILSSLVITFIFYFFTKKFLIKNKNYE